MSGICRSSMNLTDVDEKEQYGGFDIYNVPSYECITYGSMVMIRSTGKKLTPVEDEHIITLIAEEEDVDPLNGDSLKFSDKINDIPPILCNRVSRKISSQSFLLRTSGVGLSRDRECLYISLATNKPSMNPRNRLVSNFRRCDNILRYGDIVTFHSTFANNRALGVRKIIKTNCTEDRDVINPFLNSEGDACIIEIGFFRSVIGHAEKWIVLPGRQGQILTVGPSVSTINNSRYSGKKSKEIFSKRAVCIGEPIVLRNLYTGGLLSLSYKNGSVTLTIITTSLDEDTFWHRLSTEKDLSIISLVHRRNCMKVNPFNTFQLVRVNVPPCPQWAFSRNMHRERIFLNGMYLTKSSRHELPLCLESKLFPRMSPGSHSYRKMYEISDSLKDSKRNRPLSLKSRDVNIKEQEIIDEVLGCMMGFEGHFIRAKVLKYDKCKIVEDSSDSKLIEFHVSSFLRRENHFNSNILQMVKLFLPACSAFVNINAFVSSRLMMYDHGYVVHALCAAIDVLLHEYLNFVTGLNYKFRSFNKSSNQMTLSSLYSCFEPSVRIINIINHIVQVIMPLRGGELLNKLFSLAENDCFGDEKAQRICNFLLGEASIPYMEMLHFWLERGTLEDPYGEFMIVQNCEHITNMRKCLENGDVNWNNWYTVRDEHVINMVKSVRDEKGIHKSISHSKCSYLGVGLVSKIISTGKYWNALALCGNNDNFEFNIKLPLLQSLSTYVPSFSFKIDAVEISRHVDQMYKTSSKAFLHLLINENNLISNLRFIKRYFLLDQGYFFVFFLDMAEDELLKELSEISYFHVQNWMNMCLQISNSREYLNVNDSLYQITKGKYFIDSHKLPQCLLSIAYSLQCVFATQSLEDHLDTLHSGCNGLNKIIIERSSRKIYDGVDKGLTGFETFMLNFNNMPFPLSLILSRMTIINYQLLFRHIFFSKHVERRLFGTWLNHQMIKEYQCLSKYLGPTYSLRQRMLHFMQNFVCYMMFEVIEPNWLQMESKIFQETKRSSPHFEESYVDLRKQHTADDILIIHNYFVGRILKECLLTNRHLIRTLTKLCTTCLLFCEQMKLFMERTQVGHEQNKIDTEERQRRQRNIFEGNDFVSVNITMQTLRETKELQEQRQLRKYRQIKRLKRELNTDSYKCMIKKFERLFHSNISKFISQLTSDADGRYHTHLHNLVLRLDYNGYITSNI